MSLDPATLLVGVGCGAAVGAAAVYLVFYRKGGGTKVQVVQRDETGQIRKKSVTMEELDASKREMRTLMLERDLLSAALTKIYEAESDGQITREEREVIARKYSAQIREFEARLRDKELIVEVGELESLRDELVTLFRDKIQNIEARLDQAKDRLQPMREQIRPEPPKSARPMPAVPAVSPTDDLERAVERKAPVKRDDSEGERRVKELRDEVMDALAELEQIDTKKETETA